MPYLDVKQERLVKSVKICPSVKKGIPSGMLCVCIIFWMWSCLTYLILQCYGWEVRQFWLLYPGRGKIPVSSLLMSHNVFFLCHCIDIVTVSWQLMLCVSGLPLQWVWKYPRKFQLCSVKHLWLCFAIQTLGVNFWSELIPM